MGVYIRTQATKPLEQNTVQVDHSLHETWMKDLRFAVNYLETGWQNLTEAMEGNGLFILDSKNNQINFCRSVGLGDDSEAASQQIRDMMQASAEGRLFVRSKTSGMLMQIRTRTLTKDECTIDMSEEQHSIPGVEGLEEAARPMKKPKSPSIFTRIASWFSSKYAQKITAYEAALARYQNFTAGFAKLPAAKVNLNDASRNRQQTELLSDEQKARKQVKEEQQNEKLKFEAQNQHVTFGLKRYSKVNMDAAVTRMTYSEETIAKNIMGKASVQNEAQGNDANSQNVLPKDFLKNFPVKLGGKEYGALVAMAMGDPELHFTSKKDNVRMYNSPDVNYKKVVGDYFIRGEALTEKSSALAFKMTAERAVSIALRDVSEKGDYSKLAKIIANGLTQNNKMLKNQKELSDLYTGYANLGKRVLNIMESNEELKKAVMDQLGADTKQINIANAAKNISDLRVDTMKTYQNMLKDFHLFIERKTQDEQGRENVKAIPTGNYKITDITKVCMLSDIEVEMNFGRFDLENSKFADRKVVTDTIQSYEQSKVLDAYWGDKNRADILQNPIQMQTLFKTATDEVQGVLDLKNAERQQGGINEDLYKYNQPVKEDETVDVKQIFG